MRSVKLKLLMVLFVLSICIGQSVLAGQLCKDCEEIFQTGNVQSGFYDISPDGQTIIRAYCYMTADHGWTVIDPTVDPKWSGFFNGWNSYADGLAYSNGVSSSSWRQWFTLADANTVFALCPDCRQITTQDVVYKITGNYYGCYWYNRNCEFDGECHGCIDDWGELKMGTCPWLERLAPGDIGPDDTYSGACDWDWWNRAPSIGANGTHCVAYYRIGVQPPIVKWRPFWFLNTRMRLVWTPGWVTFPTGYWGGWYWWYYQFYWFYPWYGPVSWYWPYCYQYPYWAYWDYWPYYRYYHPWWHYWNWRGWPWFWGFNDRLTYWYWWRRPATVYWWSYYWDPAGQGNCLELVTMADENNPAGGRILPLDPNVINHLEVQSHQFSVNGGKVEGEFSQLEFIQTMHLEEYYRSIPGVTESEVQTFINSDIVGELRKNDPSGEGLVGVQYAQWQHPVSPLTVSDTSIALPEGAEAQYSIGLRESSPDSVTVRVVSSKPERLLIRCPDGHWDVESFFDVYFDMPQTVTIKAVDDTFSEGEETIMLANFLENDPENGFPLAVTIQDDECGGKGYHEADLNHDCKVNFYDFAIMADGWLSCTDPGQ